MIIIFVRSSILIENKYHFDGCDDDQKSISLFSTFITLQHQHQHQQHQQRHHLPTGTTEHHLRPRPLTRIGANHQFKYTYIYIYTFVVANDCWIDGLCLSKNRPKKFMKRIVSKFHTRDPNFSSSGIRQCIQHDL